MDFIYDMDILCYSNPTVTFHVYYIVSNTCSQKIVYIKFNRKIAKFKGHIITEKSSKNYDILVFNLNSYILHSKSFYRNINCTKRHFHISTKRQQHTPEF